MRERRKTRKRKSQREGNEKRRRDQKSHFRKGTRIRELERKETEKKKKSYSSKTHCWGHSISLWFTFCLATFQRFEEATVLP